MLDCKYEIKFSKSKDIKGGRLIYCPPNTLISSVSKKFSNCQIGIGGQNCHESKDYGAHTGHVNSRMLKNVGAHFVIIGHSENREKGESDKLINLKIKSALEAKLKVIFCIGETLSEKRKKKTYSILSKQIKIGLKNINNKSNIFLAYEPVWAIGSGLIPKPQDLFKTVEFIKSKFIDKLPNKYETIIGENGIRFLLISGKPIQEPVAWHGPVVMNTREELIQAFDELKNGTFIKPTH